MEDTRAAAGGLSAQERLITIIGAAVAILFFGLTVMMTSTTAAQAYKVRDLTVQRQEVLRETDRLSAEIDRLRSLSSIRERQVFLGLVPVENIHYLSSPTGNVALR